MVDLITQEKLSKSNTTATKGGEEQELTRSTQAEVGDLVTPQKTNKGHKYTAPPGFYDEWSQDQKQEWIDSNEFKIQRKMPGSFVTAHEGTEEIESVQEVVKALAEILSPSPIALTRSPLRISDPCWQRGTGTGI